jgi:hypothetical protein
MSNEQFGVNLLRAVVAQMHTLNLQTAAREMFGKSYFSLGIGDKMAVDQVVIAVVAANFAAVTPEWLAGPPPPQPVGFGIQPSEPKKETS